MVVDYHVAVNEDVNYPCYGIVKVLNYVCSDDGEVVAFFSELDIHKGQW